MFRIFTILVVVFSFLTTDAQTVKVAQSIGQPGGIHSLDERVLVHSDKNFYVCGEIMWFKVYVINAHSDKLQNLSKTAYAELMDSKGQPVLQTKIQIDSAVGDGSFYLPESLESGSYTFRAYTNWMKNDPPSFFQKQVVILNTQKTIDTTTFTSKGLSDNTSQDQIGNTPNLSGSDKEIKLVTDQESYKTRSRVDLKILSADTLKNYNLSVSVFRLNNLDQPLTDQSFTPSLQTKNNNSEFQGKSNLSDVKFLPELNGFLFIAEARDKQSGAMKEGIPVYVSVEGKLSHVKVGQTNKDGLVYFNFKDVFGPLQIVLQTDAQFEDNVDLNVVKSYEMAGITATQSFSLSPAMSEAVEELHNHALINNYFNGAKMNGFYATNPDSLSFYGKPFKTYLLDNYKRFVTLEEVLREYVQEVNVRIKNKDYTFQVFNRQYFDMGRYMTLDYMMTGSNPLVLLDGVPVRDMNKIIKYDPLKIRKLDVVADRFYISDRVWDGLISFTTYNGDLEGFKLNPKDVIVDFDGWQRPRKFYMPDYARLAVKNNRIPDFRELLYWNPNVNINDTGAGSLSFYTGDVTGKFIAVVRGISQDGHFISQSTEFDVTR